MLEDSQLSGGFSALNSGSMGAIARPYLSSQSLASTSELIDPIQQQLSLSSSSTVLNTQAVSLSLPTPTNLILDFDGDLLQAGQQNRSNLIYALPDNSDGKTFAAFNGFNLNNLAPVSSTERDKQRDEQILQIVAGVREDFSKFNVRVIWDDRGVNSPFFYGNSTVAIVTSSDPLLIDPKDKGLLGISPSPIDESQTRPDVVLAFPSAPIFTRVINTPERISRLITVISHEAGHSFGLRHPNPPDRATGINLDLSFREIMGTRSTLPSESRDSEFRTEQLQRDDDSIYDDIGRLNQNLGAALAPFPNDFISNQTLNSDNERVPFLSSETRIPIKGFISRSDNVDFVGDRDAFGFQVETPGRYTIQELSSSFAPVVSLWSSGGDFLQVSTGGTITFDAKADLPYFAVVGSTADQALTFTDPTNNAVVRGNLPDGKTGAYTLRIGRFPVAIADQATTTENEPIAFNVLTNDVTPTSTLTAKLLRSTANGTLALNSDGSISYTPNPDFFGTDSFTYSANDGSTDSDPATVTITINEATLTDLIGTPGRDMLIGTDRRDRIIGLQSSDILTGGKGRDQFVFQNINEGGDRITDFTIGKDKVVLSGVLQSINYGGSNPFADGIVSFRQASPNLAVLQIDPDGFNKATFRPVPFILFDNLSVDALSDPNNFIV